MDTRAIAVLACPLLGMLSIVTIAQAPARSPYPVTAGGHSTRRFAVDLAKMKEFYGDVLGLKPLPTLNMPGGGQMTRFHVGASEIKLQPTATESQV